MNSILREDVLGMTWGWTGVRGTWGGKKAQYSMERMKELGVNWTAIAFAALQDHPQATVIRYREEPTVTDEEIRWAVKEAHRLGLNVCLKPVVNCRNGVWRAHICFFDEEVPCEPGWSQWFASYTEFMLHYAHLAQELECEMMCIGCEMVQSDKREKEWRELIAKVRKVYAGPLTYNCDKYQEDRITWWDAVDIMSSSGYYPIHDWPVQLSRIGKAVEKEGKPFFFMETGCPSRIGSSRIPNDWGLVGEPSEEEQDRYYEAMFAACSRTPWVRGFMLWDWPAILYAAEDASTNDDYCIYGKKAANRVRAVYTGWRNRS